MSEAFSKIIYPCQLILGIVSYLYGAQGLTTQGNPHPEPCGQQTCSQPSGPMWGGPQTYWQLPIALVVGAD